MDTKTAAAIAQIKPDSLLRALCVHGHYYGIVPKKHPNRRLRWPDDFEARLLAAGSGRPEAAAATQSA